MKIIGNTNQINILVVSKDRRFRMNEFLVVDDKTNGNVIGEVMETYEIDKDDLNALSIFGIERDLKDYKNIAKVKLLNELPCPVELNSSVRLATFDEVKSVIQKNIKKEDGMMLGVIKGTENIEDIPEEWKNIVRLFEQDKGVLKQEGVPFI
ncbi:MAG: hypothetical protein IJH34_17545, partial [Romboutsia sp.]|nr:hypothetical protein [Romboutsia sp.]